LMEKDPVRKYLNKWEIHKVYSEHGRRGPKGPDGHHIDPDSAMCHCGKEVTASGLY